MSYDFNANEVFLMAEEIEENGAAFYRRAAEGMSSKESRDLLEMLAAMEDDHKKTFEQMRQDLDKSEKKSTVFDPDNDSLAYLKSLADRRVFPAQEDPTVGGGNLEDSLLDILRFAVGKEKDSIVFYLGIQDLVGEHLGRERIDDIIKEEMKHIRLLGKEIAARTR